MTTKRKVAEEPIFHVEEIMLPELDMDGEVLSDSTTNIPDKKTKNGRKRLPKAVREAQNRDVDTKAKNETIKSINTCSTDQSNDKRTSTHKKAIVRFILGLIAIIAVAVLITASILIARNYSDKKNAQRSAKTMSTVSEYQTTDINTLATTFVKDPEAAMLNYPGNAVSLSGKVYETDTVEGNNFQILVPVENQYVAFGFTVDSAELKTQIKHLKKGDTVKVNGIIASVSKRADFQIDVNSIVKQ